jgi:hypothetical protein
MDKQAEYFWTWFRDNQKHLRNFTSLSPKLQKHFCFWLGWHLNHYAKGVSFVLTFPESTDHKVELILTAQGNPEYYEKVELLAATAPKLKDWKITAFMQATADLEEMINGDDTPFVYKGISLKASEIKFEAFIYSNTKKIDLLIYIRHETIEDDYQDLMYMVYLIVESLLGEKFLYENIDHMELEPMPEKQDDEVMIALYDLKGFIEGIDNAK